MKRFVVTGGSGFLGSTICRMLVERGEDVVAFVRRGSTHPTLDALPIKRVEGDLLDAGSLRKALHGCDIAIHTAFLGRYPAAASAEVHAINGRGTETFLECCLAEHMEKVLVADTISVLAASREHAVREAQFENKVSSPWLFPYLSSKLEAGRAVRKYRDRLRIVTLYCSPMYGEGDKHDHTGRVIRHLAMRTPLAAPPGGTSVVAVEDAAAAFLLAASCDCEDEYVVTAEHLTFLAIYNMMLEALGLPQRLERVLPRWLLGPTFAAALLSDRCGRDSWFCPYIVRNGFNYRFFSSERTQAMLGWTPRKQIVEAVVEQIEWMRTNGGIRSRIAQLATNRR